MKYFLAFLLFTGSLKVQAEVARYDLFLFGDKIGSMFLSRESKPDGTEIYVLETRLKAKVLWITRDNYTRYDVIYKDGKLFSSIATEIENGETKRWANVKWDGKVYQVDSYKGKWTFTESPTYSIVKVFFGNIKKGEKLFYEAEADFNSMEKEEDSATWVFKSSDGSRNVYHYAGGVVQSAEVHVSIATVRMVRSK